MHINPLQKPSFPEAWGIHPLSIITHHLQGSHRIILNIFDFQYICFSKQELSKWHFKINYSINKIRNSLNITFIWLRIAATGCPLVQILKATTQTGGHCCHLQEITCTVTIPGVNWPEGKQMDWMRRGGWGTPKRHIHTLLCNFDEDQGGRNEVKHCVTNDAWLFQLGETYYYSCTSIWILMNIH